MKIVIISDTHCQFHNLVIPECDILISAGDYSYRGRPEEVFDFHRWMNKQKAEHLISVQGNHEVLVEKNFQLSKQSAQNICPRVNFLDEGELNIGGLKIWCSAITPWFYDWAWNRERGEDIRRHWDLIPSDTDILVTHGPPYGILDKTIDGNNVGCEDLLNKVYEIKPKIHAFGHLHESRGIEKHENIIFINASICNEHYEPINKPVVLSIENSVVTIINTY